MWKNYSTPLLAIGILVPLVFASYMSTPVAIVAGGVQRLLRDRLATPGATRGSPLGLKPTLRVPLVLVAPIEFTLTGQISPSSTPAIG